MRELSRVDKMSIFTRSRISIIQDAPTKLELLKLELLEGNSYILPVINAAQLCFFFFFKFSEANKSSTLLSSLFFF